ncbi:MBOAT family O-acyltransferase [Phenylobacterium sp.]|uniref:MBOAT family O-acyltransferase n=1 Tax=Phenylobacterium sp. TaxID=1871053 RepID=UPI002FC6C308
MLFNSPEFLVLLGTALALYWSVGDQRVRFGTLLVASLVFYAFWYPPYLIILFVLCAAAYPAALYIERADDRRANLATAGFVSFIIAVLAYFKYTGYFASLAEPVFRRLGIQIQPDAMAIALPLGISFFTFQLIAYVVDVRMKRAPAERNPLMVLLFICFFPHLIAGPICRPNQLIPQLAARARFDARGFFCGGAVLAAGLFLKAGFADNLAPFVGGVFRTAGEATGGQAVSATISFGIQILADFWGYSTMALGMAMMFGVYLPINFNLPYLATSLRDFWRRWHMTLSFWLRDYLYIPLGGSREGRFRTNLNLFITMALGGLWHGAANTFIIWGLIHGAYLVFERGVTWALGKVLPASGLPPVVQGWFARPAGWLATMGVVFVAWVFFRASSVSEAFQILDAASTPLTGWDQVPRRTIALILAFAVLMVPVHRLITAGLNRQLAIPWALAATFWLCVLAVVLQAPEPIPFIYFQF